MKIDKLLVNTVKCYSWYNKFKLKIKFYVKFNPSYYTCLFDALFPSEYFSLFRDK